MSSLQGLIKDFATKHVIDPYQSLLPWQKYCLIGSSIFLGVTGIVYFAVLQEDNHALHHNYQNEMKNIPEYQAKKIVDCNNALGECPLWDDRKGLLCWIDVEKKKFWTYDPKTHGSNSYNLPERPGSFCLCKDGSYLFAFHGGPAFYDPFKDNQPTVNPKNRIFAFETNKGTRMNDGRVDREGRFVVGGMGDLWGTKNNYIFNVVWLYIVNVLRALSGTRSAVYRINADLSYSTLFDDVIISNSICFGLDGRSMYFTDTVKWDVFGKDPRIEVYEYYPDDRAPNTNKAKVFTNKVKSSDGSVIDSQGFLWNAQSASGKVVRLDQNGDVNMIINVPSTHPTCCTFGGENLDILYITSLQPPSLSKWDCCPHDGALFAVKINEVKGTLEERFKGSAPM